MYAPDGAFCVWHEKEKAAYGEAALRGAYEEAPLLRTTVNVRGRLGLAKKNGRRGRRVCYSGGQGIQNVNDSVSLLECKF